jgi:RNA polymerase sigma-70 factor (sigma-E family)
VITDQIRGPVRGARVATSDGHGAAVAEESGDGTTRPDIHDPELETLTSYLAARGRWLTQCAYLLTRQHDAALDLVQESLLKAWKARRRLALADDPERYLLRIMMNSFRDDERRRARRPTIAFVDLAEELGSHSEPGFAAVEDASWISSALEHLNARQRAVIVLRYWADMDDEQIAELLGCRRSTVRSIAARALSRLRQLPEQER